MNSDLALIGTYMVNYFSTGMMNCLFMPQPSNCISNIPSITYQEIPPYTTAVIQVKFEKSTKIEKKRRIT